MLGELPVLTQPQLRGSSILHLTTFESTAPCLWERRSSRVKVKYRDRGVSRGSAMRRCGLVGVGLLSLLVAGGARAEILYTLEPPDPTRPGRFGDSVSDAGDLDGDGYEDVIAGAPYEEVGAPLAGRAYVFGGQTGGLLYSLESPNAQYWGYFGASVSGAGDVNGDGRDDVIVGAPREDHDGWDEAGAAYVFSGDGGGLLHMLECPNPGEGNYFGYSVSSAGDVNADGFDDTIVGNGGKAYVFNGHGGSLLLTLESPSPGGFVGSSVSSAGDVDNDGYDDVVVAGYCPGGAPDPGRAYIFSGQTGDALCTLESPNPEVDGGFGYSVSGFGDVNGDTFRDVIVGAVTEDGGATDAGRAYVFSGSGDGLLYSLESPSPKADGRFGIRVSGAGDVDNDGRPDMIVGAMGEAGGGIEGAGMAYCFSGDGGGSFYALESPDPIGGGYFGFSVSGAGDMNSDGYGDVIVGASREGDYLWAGKAYVFTFAPTSTPEDARVGPCQLVLDGPFPNPTDTDVRLSVRILKGAARHAELSLHDPKGRLITALLAELVCPGDDLSLRWSVPSTLSPGVYWWRLTTGGQSVQRPMVVVR